MGHDEVVLKVLDPRGVVPEKARTPASRRLADLRGKKIAVLNNGKAGGEMLLPYLEKALDSRLAGLELRRWRVPFALEPQVKESSLREMVEWGDAVVAPP